MIRFDGVGQFLNPNTGVIESVLMLRGSKSQKSVRVIILDTAVQEIVDLFSSEGTGTPEVEDPAPPEGMVLPQTNAASLASKHEYAGRPIAQPLGVEAMEFDSAYISQSDAAALEGAAFGEIGEL